MKAPLSPEQNYHRWSVIAHAPEFTLHRYALAFVEAWDQQHSLGFDDAHCERVALEKARPYLPAEIQGD